MIIDVYENPEVAVMLGTPSDDVIITDEGIIATHGEIDEQMKAEFERLGVRIEEETTVLCG